MRELEWALARGARVVCMRPAPAWTARRAALARATRCFDPFWARVNEAGIAVVVHAGDTGYTHQRLRARRLRRDASSGGWKPSIKSFNIERAATTS